MIKLYGVAGSRAFRSIWMLEELGLSYEHVPVHFADGGTRTPDYLAINPNGHIPTLVDGDEIYWESMAINYYLAKKYGQGLIPESVEGESHTVQWSVWAMTEVEYPLLDALLHRMFLPEEQRDPAVADAGEAKLQAPLAVLDGALAGRTYLLGETYTLADVNLASVLAWAKLIALNLEKFPNVARWLDQCCARPAAQKAFAAATGR